MTRCWGQINNRQVLGQPPKGPRRCPEGVRSHRFHKVLLMFFSVLWRNKRPFSILFICFLLLRDAFYIKNIISATRLTNRRPGKLQHVKTLQPQKISSEHETVFTSGQFTFTLHFAVCFPDYFNSTKRDENVTKHQTYVKTNEEPRNS